MVITEYREFVLVATEESPDPQGRRQVAVQVFRSPGGESGPEVGLLPPDLAKVLAWLERRDLDVAAIISLGEVLADLLLPDQARRLFQRSLDLLEPEQGLRVRLRLSPSLAGIPWEFLYLQRGQGEKDATGFLALDPSLSLVRHEALPVAGDLDLSPRPRRLLAALASPAEPGYAPLDLAKEGDNLHQALDSVPGLELDLLAPATVQGLSDRLLKGADFFHFAGHGEFRSTGLGTQVGTRLGQGEIVLVDAEGRAEKMSADQLALNLAGHGVQVAVLGACQTGRRDGENIWSGVAAAMLEVGLPAVVAMQYSIGDEAAIAFSRNFYQSLAAGHSLDQAVTLGRLGIFNLVHPGREEAESGRYWRDWGVPVLYLRSEETFRCPVLGTAQTGGPTPGPEQPEPDMPGGTGGGAWGWFRRNLQAIAAVVGIMGSLAAGFWAVYTHFSEDKPQSAGVTQTVGNIQAGGNVTVTQQHINVPKIDIPLDQFDKLLEKRLAEILAKLPQADPQDKQILLKEIDAIKEKNKNLEQAKAAYEQKLAEADQALEAFKKEFSAGQIEQAREALGRGDTKVAESLFQQALQKGQAQAAEAAFNLGGLAEARIDYAAARRAFEEAARLQPDNPAYLNAAGSILHKLGKYPEAAPYLQGALILREKTLTPDHPDVALSLNELALLYKTQGKYAAAEPLYQRSLQIKEKALGPDHPDVAVSLNNLAELYRTQGRYAEAAPLYQRSLQIREKALGPDHPAVAASLNNLAALYYSQGRYAEAEPLYQRALKVDEKSLGPDHPEVATDLENYAALLRKTGREKEAAPLEVRARAIRAKHEQANRPVEEK